MDGIALAAGVLAAQNQVSGIDTQASVLKKVMDTSESMATQLIDMMSLATPPGLGDVVNTYA